MISRLANAVGYPEKVADDVDVFAFRVDEGDCIAEMIGPRLVLKRYLDVKYEDLNVFAAFAAGRMLREEAVLSWDDRAGRAFLWREIRPGADQTAMREAFEEFADSCDWWMRRVAETGAPVSVFPDIMIRP